MFKAPVQEIAFTLNHIADLEKDMEGGLYGELSDDLVNAILEEGGKFASEEVAPMHGVGDEKGSTLKDAVVTTPPGWKELYTKWAEGGWNSLSAAEEFGGQGLPNLMSVAAQEMWNAGSVGFGLCPTLTIGAVEAIEAHAVQEIKEKYLPKMISGEWTGTMNLTAPQSGSDLGGKKSKAEPQEAGSNRISGQKIYITYGVHDLPSGNFQAMREVLENKRQIRSKQLMFKLRTESYTREAIQVALDFLKILGQINSASIVRNLFDSCCESHRNFAVGRPF